MGRRTLTSDLESDSASSDSSLRREGVGVKKRDLDGLLAELAAELER